MGMGASTDYYYPRQIRVVPNNQGGGNTAQSNFTVYNGTRRIKPKINDQYPKMIKLVKTPTNTPVFLPQSTSGHKQLFMYPPLQQHADLYNNRMYQPRKLVMYDHSYQDQRIIPFEYPEREIQPFETFQRGHRLQTEYPRKELQPMEYSRKEFQPLEYSRKELQPLNNIFRCSSLDGQNFVTSNELNRSYDRSPVYNSPPRPFHANFVGMGSGIRNYSINGRRSRETDTMSLHAGSPRRVSESDIYSLRDFDVAPVDRFQDKNGRTYKLVKPVRERPRIIYTKHQNYDDQYVIVERSEADDGFLSPQQDIFPPMDVMPKAEEATVEEDMEKGKDPMKGTPKAEEETIVEADKEKFPDEEREQKELKEQNGHEREKENEQEQINLEENVQTEENEEEKSVTNLPENDEKQQDEKENAEAKIPEVEKVEKEQTEIETTKVPVEEEQEKSHEKEEPKVQEEGKELDVEKDTRDDKEAEATEENELSAKEEAKKIEKLHPNASTQTIERKLKHAAFKENKSYNIRRERALKST